MKPHTPAATGQTTPDRGEPNDPPEAKQPTILDLRDLPPPEPLQRSLEAVMALAPGAKLVVRTRFRPAHLIDQLNARNCAHESTARGDDGWDTTIWRRP